MNYQIPTVIFVPRRRDDKLMDCVADPVPLFSRWSERTPMVSASPPKLPKREVNKSDSVPKLPRRCSINAREASASSQKASDAGSRIRSSVMIGNRRVRSLPLSHGTLADSLESASTVSTASEIASVAPIARSEQAPRTRLSASAIVEKVHQQTSRVGPELRQIAARAA